MMRFLIAGDPSVASLITAAVEGLAGGRLSPCCWLAEWRGTAQSLHRHVVHKTGVSVVVCSFDGDSHF